MSNLSITDMRELIARRTLEKHVQKAICDYLDAMKIPYAVTNAEEAYNRRGRRVQRVNPHWPDITGCYAGFFIGLEVKRAVGGTLSYGQAERLSKLYAQGALICVPRSVDEVAELLRTKQVSQRTKDEIIQALAKGPKPKRRHTRRQK